MKKVLHLILDFLLLSGLLYMGHQVFNRYFYHYALGLFQQAGLPIPQSLVSPFVVLLISGSLFLLIRPLYTHTLKVSHVTYIYLAYALALIFGLFAKNVGASGFNLDLSTSLMDLHYDTITVFLNLIMFIPLGLLFRPRLLSLLGFLLFIFAIEYSQYYFALGYFDIGDILANSLGFWVGCLLGHSQPGQFIREQLD